MSELRRAREQRKWSQSRAIAAMQDQARALGITLPAASSLKTELSRWENGHRTPDALYRRIFERIYGQSALDLGLVPVSPASDVDLGASWEDNALSVAQLWKSDVSRRDFLKSTAFSAVGFAAPSLHAVLNLETSPTSRSVGLTGVDQSKIIFIQEMTTNLSRLDNQFGGGQVRRAAVTFLDGEISPLLTSGQFSASVGRSLLRATAELARLVGWMTHDAGRHGLAQRYLIQALHLADAADDKALVAETLAAMSQQSTYMGDARQAVDLARAAKSVAVR